MGGVTMRSIISLSAVGVLAAVAGSATFAFPQASGQPPAGPGVTPGVPNPAEAQPSPDEIRKMMAGAKPGGDKPDDLKPFAEVAKDFEKVVSTADGQQSLYTIWTRAKDQAMLAELPRGYEGQKHFVAMTVGSGEVFAGLQAGDMYVYWKRLNNRLLLIEPNIETRSTGDRESKDSVKRLFTDRVVLDVPILTTGPSGQPVIDLRDLLTSKASGFWGGGFRGANASLATIKTAKAFPENIEVAFEMPMAGGRLQILHYSVSVLKGDPSYQPRVADERVGYFTTTYRDLGKFEQDKKWTRYINRWHLEKRDPKLKISPPKEPIVYYVEHTVPVRYRQWVKQGTLLWNKAYEKVGIRDAIEVYYQDAETGAHMEKDPEDVRYNFLRWLSNDISTAIGPSRANPMTGQILDADIVLTDGWIRSFWGQYSEVMPELAMESFTPETLSWLETHPNWDPRFRLAAPEKRNELMAQRMRAGVLKYGGHPLAATDPAAMGIEGYDGLIGRLKQPFGLCMAAKGKALDMAVGMMQLEIAGLLGEADLPDTLIPFQPEADKDKAKDDKKDDKKDEKKKDEKGDLLDGIPDWFVGPLLADLTAHEVGHTLGLRHNFKASSVYTLAQINSPEFKGKKTFVGSVMDYTSANFNMQDGVIQGDFAPIDIGPYDMWAIDYGYTAGDTKDVLKRVAEPELVYATDEDTIGPDPLARRYDFSANPLDFAKSQMRLAKYHRERLIEKFVKDGESWSKLRRGYSLTLSLQTRALSMEANWIGGAFVNRDRKGDPNARIPTEVVPAAVQRDALKFCIDNAFKDEAFGLKADLIARMTVDKWADNGGGNDLYTEATFPIHDRIMGIQASTLTMLMNPTTLRRVYDNEFRVPADQDTITLPEVMDSISAAIWTEIDNNPSQKYSARQPMVSSLRRNLQREHMERLIDLTMPSGGLGAAAKPIANLATAKLRSLRDKMASILDAKSTASSLDPYTVAHLSEARIRIDKALDAQYIYNSDQLGGGGFHSGFFFNQPPQSQNEHGREQSK